MKTFFLDNRGYHGINLPLPALRSQRSCGIGEFFDLIPLMHWVKEIGFDIIQLLPLNDSGEDASPYNALSAFALNPIYLSIEALGELRNTADVVEELKQCNRAQKIPYQEVYRKKGQFLKIYFLDSYEKISSSEAYQNFLQENSFWLPGYAACKSQRYGESSQFHEFVQYLCATQMREVKRCAEEIGLWIKGDIPILVSPYSIDVELFPEIFNKDYSAGAPPDAYSDVGQNWGFPLYNWDVLKSRDYDWWKERLKLAENFYHIYRLDHIVGFFRIWAIPKGKTDGRDGSFIPNDEQVWLQKGEEILRELMKSSNLLPIGEDLGAVPPNIKAILQKLGICGTKVMRWERFWDTGGAFIPIDQYPRLSMTTVSTHDSETLALWWRDKPEESGRYAFERGWSYQREISTWQYRAIMHDSHASNSLFHINLLNEYFPLAPELCWPTIEEERINIPGTISDNNWTYRFKPYLEEIITHNGLKEAMSSLLDKNGSTNA
jgi:4-alpha-glucanotransferase